MIKHVKTELSRVFTGGRC